MRVLIDGVPTTDADASVSVFDWVVIRGFGVFEVIRSYGGSPFRLEPHLDRLERSAAALGIPCPARVSLRGWVEEIAAGLGDGYVRIILTGGGRDPAVASPSRTLVMGEQPLEVPDRLSVLPTAAPWHPATDAGGFPGVKWVSYAPNVASTDRARQAGYSDALLISQEGFVLEGPTFTVAWFVDGRIETPALELGILGSITREVMLECARGLGLEVRQGRHPLERLTSADEAFALSTVIEVRPIDRIGEWPLPVGPISASLGRCFAEVVDAETGREPVGLP